MTWEKGRQLKSFDCNTYTYNANGIRTSKTVNGVLHTYTLDGTKILREAWNGSTLVPLYDTEDAVCGILYNHIPYYFIKNLQGDIITIVDKDAKTVARYTYDAWGVPTITHDSSDCNIATINPFRYRSYYYDQEIELYYISSRYYDSQTARWLSSDHSAILTYAALPLSCGLFTYCCNNPVNNIDLAGYLAFSMTVIISAAIVGAVFNAISQIALNYLSGKRGSQIFKGVLGAAVGGAVNSALLLVLWYVPGSNIIAGFIAGFVQSVIDALFDVLVYKTLSWRNFLKECTVKGLWNSAANVAGNYLGGKLVYINRGWFKPKYVASFLKGSYGQRLIAQTGIGAILNLIVNLIRKLFKL